MGILDELGLDERKITWQDLAHCKNVVQPYIRDGQRKVFDPLFDDYEDDEEPYNIRKATDSMCIGCPVQQHCFRAGRDGGESGVWGGVYLSYGKIDRTRNEHKSDEVWKKIKEEIGIDGIHE